ncbi:hypothetical protein [Erwinia sp. V71]|uniref:hypothetical protein n=1 Tax=Erwinia sp. V71 TaxID=3369424 RepID=UPI003F5EC88F
MHSPEFPVANRGAIIRHHAQKKQDSGQKRKRFHHHGSPSSLLNRKSDLDFPEKSFKRLFALCQDNVTCSEK